MIRTSLQDGIAEIAMDRPPVNALNLALLGAIEAAHADACRGGARVILLTGRAGMFSAGLDVPELLPQPRAAIEAFWTGFFRLTRALVTSAVPVVAVVSGHAPAGGAVIAIHCDYRIGARGDFRIGLNEVSVGLPIPDGIMLALEHIVGPRMAQRLGMTAELLSMENALGCGLLDELAEPDRLMEQSRAWARRLAALPPVAMNRTRLLARARLAAALEPVAGARVAADLWFSDETQAGMRALVERLARK
ncbi:MAG: enoyl-CoA hydratase/isomerase family protein [Gammaproteobacteria bacterium]|nr:MAG: enoyl-CoA hydratase/isomerase family protein [Gammaproteobacteria bacterium]